jgi:hypothetical protein
MKVYQSVLGRICVVILLWVAISSFATFGIIGAVSAFAACSFVGIGGMIWVFTGALASSASSLPDYEFEHAEFDHEEADAQKIADRNEL